MSQSFNGGQPREGPELTEAISAAMVDVYAEVYDHDRTTATTCINDNIVLCVLEKILTERSVVAFVSANQTAPGVACELSFLDAAPPTEAVSRE